MGRSVANDVCHRGATLDRADSPGATSISVLANKTVGLLGLRYRRRTASSRASIPAAGEQDTFYIGNLNGLGAPQKDLSLNCLTAGRVRLPTATNGAHTRHVGASARRRCRSSLTGPNVGPRRSLTDYVGHPIHRHFARHLLSDRVIETWLSQIRSISSTRR